jgi:predicted P-loop ATPase
MAESRIDRINEMLDEAAASNRSLDDVALEILNGHDHSQENPNAPARLNPAQIGLETNAKGTPHMNLDNVVRVIEASPHLKGHLWYDEFLDSIITDWCGPERQWKDRDDVLLQLYMQRYAGLTKVGLATCHDAALVAAFNDTRNELHAYLNGLQWDGVERLGHLMADGFGAQHNAYTQAVGRCWMVSMVARAFNPGCKVDTVPIFEGEQGMRKSSALQVIGGKWFTECHESVTSKDFFGVLKGHLLAEISEMHSFSRSEIERIKGIISCQVDRYRKAYGRHTEDHPRHTVLVGTTNRDDYHKDETGGRRFLPILCNEINILWLREQRDQLFAEAIALYRRVPVDAKPEQRLEAGAAWWDIPMAEHKQEIEARRDTDSWEPLIEEWLTGRARVTVGQVLLDCLKIDAKDHDQMRQKRVGRVMRSLKWGNKTVRDDDGKLKKMWINEEV